MFRVDPGRLGVLRRPAAVVPAAGRVVGGQREAAGDPRPAAGAARRRLGGRSPPRAARPPLKCRDACRADPAGADRRRADRHLPARRPRPRPALGPALPGGPDPRATASTSAHDGTGWVLEIDRPEVDRMEYLFQVTAADGSIEWLPDPANPARVAGAFGEKSVLELPGLRGAAAGWTGPARPAGAATSPSRPARCRARCPSRCGPRTGCGDRTPGAAAGRARRTGVRRAGRPHGVPLVPGRHRRPAAGAGRAARPGPPRRAVLGGRRVHPRPVPGRPPPAARRGRDHVGRRRRRQPRRARDAARAAAERRLPRRAVPAVRARSSTRATTRTSAGSSATSGSCAASTRSCAPTGTRRRCRP